MTTTIINATIHTVGPLSIAMPVAEGGTANDYKNFPVMTRGVDEDGNKKLTGYLPATTLRGFLRRAVVLREMKRAASAGTPYSLQRAYAELIGQDAESEKAEEEKKSDDTKKDAEKSDEKKAEDEKKPDDKKPDEVKPEEKKEVKYKPLADVREEILTKLAQPIAQEARTKAVKEVTDAINDYGKRYRRWLSVKEFKKDAAQEPAKLDLEALAANSQDVDLTVAAVTLASARFPHELGSRTFYQAELRSPAYVAVGHARFILAFDVSPFESFRLNVLDLTAVDEPNLLTLLSAFSQ